MNQQEEIEKLAEKYISKAYWYEGRKNIVVSITKELIKALDKKRVVIKVDRELPDNEAWHKVEREFEAYCAGRNDMLQAGYATTIPLRKEAK